ncbi:O-methyltransferase 1, chloroplastic isoform X2 [Malania oleifera]|uniref:O-methyltransferase 1, chloroplastic isoform X2 n=1 Tax=Malania oleifera TaxID=397392 RepID=UPI0025ADF6D2|nr:O-methyltransferase 1, chloroplastic isoform X2 [Malania oleifera]
MECLVGFAPGGTAAAPVRPSLICASKTRKNGFLLRAKLNGEDDPLVQAAINAATVRFQETNQPEPLFLDPYAGCFVPPDIEMDLEHYPYNYCLATRFIDDKLLSTMNHIDGLKQVVLLTDGMDTRPYRLSWPTSTIIFDISPERVFRIAAEKLEAVGAKIPRSCLLLHVPLESSNIEWILRSQGFNGNRPSIWALQGLPVMTLASFEEILLIVRSLAMKGCLLLGELPAWLSGTEAGFSAKTWMDKLFMSNGFRVDVTRYNEVARSLRKQSASSNHKNILFIAEHLRFSDDQARTH